MKQELEKLFHWVRNFEITAIIRERDLRTGEDTGRIFIRLNGQTYPKATAFFIKEREHEWREVSATEFSKLAIQQFRV